MGLGITLAFALKGFHVALVDGKERPPEAYEGVRRRAEEEIRSNVKFLRKVGYLKGTIKGVLSRISFTHELNRGNFEAPFIFEAIPEKPDLKIKLLRRISPYLPKEAVLASATSTIDLKTLRKGTARPDRLLITHWLNPAFIVPLVEIAVSDGTEERSIDRMRKVLKEIGKISVVLKDGPGFIVPRISALAMNEAIRILEEGVATAEDIDTAIKTGFAFSSGSWVCSNSSTWADSTSFPMPMISSIPHSETSDSRNRCWWKKRWIRERSARGPGRESSNMRAWIFKLYSRENIGT